MNVKNSNKQRNLKGLKHMAICCIFLLHQQMSTIPQHFKEDSDDDVNNATTTIFHHRWDHGF